MGSAASDAIAVKDILLKQTVEKRRHFSALLALETELAPHLRLPGVESLKPAPQHKSLHYSTELCFHPSLQ